jgi:hypothetical protein
MAKVVSFYGKLFRQLGYHYEQEQTGALSDDDRKPLY